MLFIFKLMLIKYWYMHACRSKLQYFNLQGIIIFLHRSVGQQICEWKIYHWTIVMYFIANICYAMYMQVTVSG